MLILEEERYNIIGAAFEVHSILGMGFSEYVYQDALEIEFKSRGIPYVREKQLIAKYKDIELKHVYYADFVCYDDIVVECKAVDGLLTEHEAQLLNYLKISNNKVGILLNFGEKSLRHRAKVN